MSDSDSDDNNGERNGNYKSPGKRKRQMAATGGAAPKTYQFNISLSATNGDDYTEVSYLDLVAKEEQKIRKLAIAKKAERQMSLSGLDPYASDDGDKLKKLAADLEAKYAEKPKKKGGKKRKINDYDHLAEGYDASDPFIDDSECFDEVVPQEITTAHGGFYINTGALEFKENKKAVYNLSSDEEDVEKEKEPLNKKVKKPKKEPISAATKKQVKFKDEKPAAVAKKKPKMKNAGTDVKRKARIIKTDPNIKGPGAKGAPPKGDGNNIKKVEPKKIEMKKLELPKPVENAIPRQKSPEKSVPKPPEIIDLESQLMAFCKDIELSKSDSKAYGFSKPSTPTQKAGASSVKSNPSIQELKLPPSVRVTKVEKQNVTKDVLNSSASVTKSTLNVSKVSTPTSAVNVSKVAPTVSGKGATTNKGGVSWHNQVSFSPTKSDFDALLASKDTKPTNPAPKSIFNSANNKKNTSSEAANTPKDAFDKRQPSSSTGLSASSQQSSPRQPKAPSSVSLSSAASAAPSMPMFSAASSNPQASMFQHDPKNILASSAAMTTMSSILGTTAPYFAQKLQQKSGTMTEAPILTQSNPTSSSHLSKSETTLSSVKNTQSQGSYSSFKASPSPSGGSMKAQSPQSPLNLSTAPGVTKQSPGLVTTPSATALSTHSYPYQQKQINQITPQSQATAGPNRGQVPQPQNTPATSRGQVPQSPATPPDRALVAQTPAAPGPIYNRGLISENLTSHNAGQASKPAAAAKIVSAPSQIGQQSRSSSSSSSVLSAEMTQTLLLQAEHMMINMEHSASSPSPTSLSPSVAPPPPKQNKPPAPATQQPQPQQQHQQQSYISQFQNFASQQKQVIPQQQHQVQQQSKNFASQQQQVITQQQHQSKKSSSYGISDLLNSQPLPPPSSANNSTPARQGGGQAMAQGRAPAINQQPQQKQVNVQPQLPLNLQHSQPHAQYQQQNVHLPKTVSGSSSRASASALSSSPSLSSAQAPLSIPASLQPQTMARSQPQIPNFSSQQMQSSGMSQQPMTQQIAPRQQQQQSVSRQQQQQLQQQQTQALLQQFNQYNYLGGY